jgi:hypothetical protein
LGSFQGDREESIFGKGKREREKVFYQLLQVYTESFTLLVDETSVCAAPNVLGSL